MTVYIFYVISDRQVSEKAIYVFECYYRRCDTQRDNVTQDAVSS